MSFILDALRKSENERQQDTVPSVTRVPLAPPRQKLPGWALGVMATLVVSVLVVTGAWWRSTQNATPQAAAAAGVSSAQTEVARADVAPADASSEDAAGRAPQAAVQRRDPPGIAVPLRRLADAGTTPTGAEETAPAAAVPAARQGSVRIAPADPDARTLPNLSDLSGRGVAFPRLTLELHSFGTEPEHRYVYINGHRYREGDTLDEGPRLLRVDSSGAVLTYQGTDFRLSRE